MPKKTRFIRQVLNNLTKFSFSLIFWFFMLGFLEGIHKNVSLLYFFSICAVVPLLIHFVLRLKNMSSKIPISLLCYSISVFKILLQTFLLINSLSILCTLKSVKVLMISCRQTKIWMLLPTISKEYNNLKKY